ncbi:MAG: hypothetical protein ACK2US_09110, partial [Anaerolineae bacterium]
MSSSDKLTRRVQAGEIIKPWLILGPFYEDLSAQVEGLTFFEKPGATVGRAAMAEIVEDAGAILAASPREGSEDTLRGQTARWSLVRRPEKYLSWGTYNISNHLGAAFLSTVVTPDTPGTRRWRLLAGLSQRAVVAINGEIVYDTDGLLVDREVLFIYDFEAALQPGENVVTVGLFRLARMAQVGCRLEIADSAATAQVPLSDKLPFEARTRVEEELAILRLARDVFYPEHAVGLTLGVAPESGAQVAVSLLSKTGETLREAAPTAAGTVDLCQGEELADGDYQILCRWLKDGQSLTSTAFDIHKVTPVPAPAGYNRLEERKQAVLAHYAANEKKESRPDIWREVARYALGHYAEVDEVVEVDESAIRDTCAFIAARKDCADFVIQGLLRLMAWERETPRLSPQINAMMKDTVLGFKYWVDEPGDTVMYMGSENHRLLFHVAEWMAGQLFPTEEFTNSRQRGLYHATKGRTYITEWLRQRGRFGFDEWHSNSYYPICIAPLINVVDFAIHEDHKLRQMAEGVLDYMFFNMAADSLRGVFGTTHGRSYGIY